MFWRVYGQGPTSFDSIAYQALHVSLHTRQLVSCSETLSWNGCLLWQAANKMWAGPATATWCCRFWQPTISRQPSPNYSSTMPTPILDFPNGRTSGKGIVGGMNYFGLTDVRVSGATSIQRRVSRLQFRIMILDESLKPTAYNTGQHRGLYLENMAGSGFGLFNSCRARRSLLLLLLLLLLLRTLVHGCHPPL